MVSGGLVSSNVITASCEVYPSSIGWQNASAMRYARFYHTFTPFASKTKVLTTGSVTQIWTLTSTNMSTGRYEHTAALMTNGQILIAGGRNPLGISTSTAELFIPSSNSFINTSSMNTPRTLLTSTLLNDGLTVLVTGGGDDNNEMLATAELYISGSWAFTASSMTQQRAYHASVLLNDGTILIAGGGDGRWISFSTAEIFNPTTRTFTAVQSMKYSRAAFTLTLLPSGQVLATGGVDWTTGTFPVVSELYNPLTKSWSDTRILNNGRSSHQTVLLNDSVLMIGGLDSNMNQLASCEKYNL
jgi:hypothetical protein